MKRSKHTLSHYRMVTCNMGQLIPIGCVPVLPGDTFQHSTSALVRVSPLNTPVMHPVSVRIHHFFVPNRLSWDGWEDFITGGEDGFDTSSPPTTQNSADPRSLPSYIGVPPITGVSTSNMAVRACNQIFNEYYRDQDLTPKVSDTTHGIQNVAWEKDYFTTARPWTQKGPEVTLPVGSAAPIFAEEGVSSGSDVKVGNPDNPGDVWDMNSGVPTKLEFGNPDAGGLPNMYADLSSASAININDFRTAFSLQRYQEARARYGSRFTEYLRYLGVTPSDARLQRPEFLGGGTTRLNFSEVLQTAPQDASAGETDSKGIGDLFGHGIAGVRTNKYRKFFEEHGYVITMLSARPKSIYMNGVPREFLKTTKEDFYQKELVNLGQQEVLQSELYAEADSGTFGFQDRYHEYRSQPSQIGQDFRTTLNAWHLGRELQEGVTLNADFVKCDPSRRIFQVTDTSVDTLWIMANHHIVARRLVPARANPRII